MPNTIVSDVFCEIKYIRRDRFRMNIWANLSEPIHDAWFHFEFYYRYNPTTYQKFPVDLWENICDWFEGKRAHILDWTVGKVLKYSNLNHPCPYIGHVYIRTDNLTTNDFPIEQLFPSGKYRIDVHFTDGNKSNVLVKSQYFFSISDYRIERF